MVPEKVNLVANDGGSVEVPWAVIDISNLIYNMILDLDAEDDDMPTIPLPNVDTATLKLVIEYCVHHKDSPRIRSPETVTGRSTHTRNAYDVGAWDAQFCSFDDKEPLMALILASNYLDIPCLLDTCCKVMANSIRGRTPEEIRNIFNIQDDPTPETVTE